MLNAIHTHMYISMFVCVNVVTRLRDALCVGVNLTRTPLEAPRIERAAWQVKSNQRWQFFFIRALI